MITRRSLLPRLGLLAAGGAGLWLARDRLPWPPLRARFTAGDATPWMPLPSGSRLIELAARVNGTPVRAVVDSGAQLSAIDRRLAQRLDLPQPVSLPILAYGVSGKPDLTHMVRIDLAFPGLTVEGLRPAALDIGSVSAATGRAFELLVGRDLLRDVVLEADFPRDRARFVARHAHRPAPDAMSAHLRRQSGAPMIQIQIEQAAPLEVMVDTGATGALALSDQAARNAGLLGRPVRQAHSVGLAGLSIDRLVTARSLSLAGLHFRDVPVQIYTPSSRVHVPAGLLGGGLLGRFAVALDLSGDRLHLTPAALRMAPPPRRN